MVKRLEKKATKEQVKELKAYAKPAVEFVAGYKDNILRLVKSVGGLTSVNNLKSQDLYFYKA